MKMRPEISAFRNAEAHFPTLCPESALRVGRLVPFALNCELSTPRRHF